MSVCSSVEYLSRRENVSKMSQTEGAFHARYTSFLGCFVICALTFLRDTRLALRLGTIALFPGGPTLVARP